MYGYGYGYYGFDWTYVLLIIGMLLSLAASTRLKSTFSYYRRIRSASGLTGAETAERILRAAGITDVHVRAISGSLTDHYDPRTKTVSLSEDIYDKTSLPVEINASSRALKMLQSTGILGSDETKGARKVLTAAAMTYVAALAASILQLLRLLILAGGRRRDD